MANHGQMTRRERRNVQALSAINMSRLLGLYMVLPVLSPYARDLRGSTDILIGLSLGAYGATQAMFQIPFGYLSDRIGRRRAITIGLILFGAGSFLAAVARDAWLLVAARSLQGSGAISSALIAMIADTTRPEVRTQAMSQVGVWIGGAFAVSIVVGPTLGGLFGVPALFVLTGLAAVVSILYLNLRRLDPPPAAEQRERLHAADLPSILRHPSLLVIDVGIFLLHVVVTVLFVLLPFDLERIVAPGRIWMILAPAIGLGLLVMTVSGRLSDRYRIGGLLFFAGVVLQAASCLLFAYADAHLSMAVAGLFVFVVALAILEPTLVSMLSRFSAGPHRGTASGVFSMAQFAGAFVGGLLGGAFLGGNEGSLFAGLLVASLLWGASVARVFRLRPFEDGQAPVRSAPSPADPPLEEGKRLHQDLEAMREADRKGP